MDDDARASLQNIGLARETYVDDLEYLLGLHDELDGKLTRLKTESNAAGAKLDEVYRSLSDDLKTTQVVSTASSAVSIVGALMIFTPLMPLGLGLTLGGAAVTTGSTVVEKFVFESEASASFKKVIEKFTAASHELEVLFQNIETAKEKLNDSLQNFLSLLAAYTSSQIPGADSAGSPGSNPLIPGSHYTPNEFSKGVVQGLVASASVGSKLLIGKSGHVLLRTLPAFRVLSKALPIVSIIIDAGSILGSWTIKNETLEQNRKLQIDIADNLAAFVGAVRKYKSSLEEQTGGKRAEQTLRKLLLLRKCPLMLIPAPPPQEKKVDEKLASKSEDEAGEASVDKSKGDPFKASVDNADGGASESPIAEASQAPAADPVAEPPLRSLRYTPSSPLSSFSDDDPTVNVIPKSDLLQLAKKSLCAPVVDSAFEKFPDLRALADWEVGRRREVSPTICVLQGELENGATWLDRFDAVCARTSVGDEEVFRVKVLAAEEMMRKHCGK